MQRDIKNYTRRGACGAPTSRQQHESHKHQRAAKSEAGAGGGSSSLLHLLGRGSATVTSGKVQPPGATAAAPDPHAVPRPAATAAVREAAPRPPAHTSSAGPPSWLSQPGASAAAPAPSAPPTGLGGPNAAQSAALPWKAAVRAAPGGIARPADRQAGPSAAAAASADSALRAAVAAQPGAALKRVLQELPLHRAMPPHQPPPTSSVPSKPPLGPDVGRHPATATAEHRTSQYPLPANNTPAPVQLPPNGGVQRPPLPQPGYCPEHCAPRQQRPQAQPPMHRTSAPSQPLQPHPQPLAHQHPHPHPHPHRHASMGEAPVHGGYRCHAASDGAGDAGAGAGAEGEGEGALVVLGERSKRAAARRAGLDSERLRQLRAVRARREEGEAAGRRFNHWDDGAGSWDYDTLGIDGADECDMRWEGVGCTTVGPRM